MLRGKYLNCETVYWWLAGAFVLGIVTMIIFNHETAPAQAEKRSDRLSTCLNQAGDAAFVLRDSGIPTKNFVGFEQHGSPSGLEDLLTADFRAKASTLRDCDPRAAKQVMTLLGIMLEFGFDDGRRWCRNAVEVDELNAENVRRGSGIPSSYLKDSGNYNFVYRFILNDDTSTLESCTGIPPS